VGEGGLRYCTYLYHDQASCTATLSDAGKVKRKPELSYLPNLPSVQFADPVIAAQKLDEVIDRIDLCCKQL
jgi:hypothetical protein